MRKTRLLFAALASVLAVTRLCHSGILWEGDAYPLAAAGQMLRGSMLYRDIWFDKPPLLAVAYVLFGALPGWPLRLAGALYALLTCWLAYRLATDFWSEREGRWAAALMAFFLSFDFPAAVIPVASDMLMVAPHLAAVWLAVCRKPFWSGAVAGVAFWISPKGVFVAAACAVWYPGGIALMAAGFLASSAVVMAWLTGAGALTPYVEQVWRWGRIYAARPFLEDPARNGVMRTLNWAGFHVALVVAAAWFAVKNPGWRWLAWLAVATAGVAAGMRFFPRYYLLLLPVLTLTAARGCVLMGRRQAIVLVLLLIPFVRFGPTYLTALRDAGWRDTAMDRDSWAAAALLKSLARPGDTLFVWGYRPELYVYTRLLAASRYLDSQPLTGVPADRHLTESQPVENQAPAQRRRELASGQPTFLVDGLGLYNPRLAITQYDDLREWLNDYREVARSSETVIYRRTTSR